MDIKQIFEGAIGKRGMFTGYYIDKKGEEKKNAIEQQQHINWEDHLSGRSTFGISPVKIIQDENRSIGLCRWIALDIDIDTDPKEFCSSCFKISVEAIPVSSTSGRWHIYYFLDDWTDVKEARKIAEELEQKFKKVYGKDVDLTHTLPKAWTVADNKPGYWMFMPYSNNKDLKNVAVAYSPSGKPLTKEQFEFRVKYRKHPMIASSVASVSPGRHKVLFNCRLYIEHNHLDVAILKEVNKNFDESLDDTEFELYKNHLEKSVKKEEYTKEYLDERINTYIKEATDISVKSDLLKGFGETERSEEQKAFLDNVIYMKLDDFFYDKSTEQQYPRKNMNIIYGEIATKETGVPVNYFAKSKEKKMVELGVYRPDLYKENKDPISKNDEGLLVLNHYKPGRLEIMLPDTPERRKELDTFMTLVEGLTEKEGTGTRIIKGKDVEFKLSEYLLDHLSMPFQRPGVKTRSAIVLHSKQYQTGKSTLFEIIRQSLGSKNCTIIKPDNAIARELSFIENQLVFVDEIKIDGNIEEKKSILNRLKPLITQELHDSRPLFKEWRQVFSTICLMFSTNFKDAMAMSFDEARYTPIDVAKDREQMGGDTFFDPMWNWLKYPDDYPNTFTSVVKGYLSSRKFTPGFDHAGKSLKTDFLKEMAESGGTPLYTEIKTLLYQREEPFDQSVISLNQAWIYMKKEYNIKGKLNDFAEFLIQLGAERVGECKHRRTRKHPMIFIVRNHDYFADKTKSQIVNECWKPIGTVGDSNPEWNLSGGDMGVINKRFEEIEEHEDHHEHKYDKDQTNTPWIEIKRKRERNQ
tara:strand:+ start:41 stop:2458 length:2418 start_codon:yes stop_codon:yes gene_type:complete